MLVGSMVFAAVPPSTAHSKKSPHLLEALVDDAGLENTTTTRDSMKLDFLHRRGLVPRASGSTDTSGQTSSSATSQDYTCGPNKPCSNGACCGASGWCGYSPTFCGTGCQSNCDAKAECGQYAATPGQTCPLNVCCSEFGFCGTTSDFCGTGCQSNCNQPIPAFPPANVHKKIIAYFEGWNAQHACGTMQPEEIPVESLTHLNLAFGYISPGSYQVTPMDGVPADWISRVTNQKSRNPSLKVSVALGGWTFTDPGTWREVFTDMVSSPANRQTFISNLFGFLSQYGFDGVDFDWEYPGAADRGGVPIDGANYVEFLKELHDANHNKYIVTFTAPTSYWYLRGFDINAMMSYVDWMNLMSYDLHGVWDQNNPIGSHVLAHTNTTEIDLALDLLWRNNINPNQIVLGMGFYGRSFKLSDPNCWRPGCLFSGAGDAGPCTATQGILSYREVMDVLSSSNAQPYYDDAANVNYIVYGQNNWISFDNAKSFRAKIDFANSRGLNGLMIWAVDLDDAQHTALTALTGSGVDVLSLPDISDTSYLDTNANAGSQCRVTDCAGFCDISEKLVGKVKGGCSGNEKNARAICCPAWSNLTPNSCDWYKGKGGVATDCAGQCAVGQIEILTDSDGWVGDIVSGHYGTHCLRGGWAFCCDVGNEQQYLDICTWTACGGTCPSSSPYVLTIDSGGPIGPNPRCDTSSAEQSGGGDPFDPNTPSGKNRKLCCPKKDSFTNCAWKNGKVCSESCGLYQLTLDTDPQGTGGKYCDNGRQQVFCCDPPGGTKRPFLPVDLDMIFPPQYLPPPDAVPDWDLVTFNGLSGLGDPDPNKSGFAFFVIAGSSTAVSSMNKRDAPGLVFLDCPNDILAKPHEEIRTVRIICLDEDTEKCFGIRRNGVEGTVVHMPAECGEGSWARAVSLEPSQNQSIPIELARQNPTSAVYDFAFDYNIPLVRRDAGDLSIRADFSNLAGYWSAVVNSPGSTTNAKRDLNQLVERFYSSNYDEWFSKFDSLNLPVSKSALEIHEDISQLVFYQGQSCSLSDGAQSGEGIAIGITGNLDATPYYGFSMIATWNPSAQVQIHESAGFIRIDGSTIATFEVGGVGTIDTAQANQGGQISKKVQRQSIGGESVYHGWLNFSPYWEQTVSLKAENGNTNQVSFNGYMEASAKATWSSKVINFPQDPSSDNTDNLQVNVGANQLATLGTDQSAASVIVTNEITFGISITWYMQKPYQNAVGILPEMTVSQSVSGMFFLAESSDLVCLTTALQQVEVAGLSNSEYIGWDGDYNTAYVLNAKQVGSPECFSAPPPNKKKKKRQNNTGPPYALPEDPLGGVPHPDTLIHWPPYAAVQEVGVLNNGNEQVFQCVSTLQPPTPCCGCDSIDPDPYVEDDTLYSMPLPGIDDIPPLLGKRSDMTLNEGNAASIFGLVKRDPGSPPSYGNKTPKICKIRYTSLLYPAYPDVSGTGQSELWPISDGRTGFDIYVELDPDGQYYHNVTGNCIDFGCTQYQTYDRIYIWPTRGTQGVPYHQFYDTEHILEAQTISRFIENWVGGRWASQRPSTKRDCNWVNQYLGSAYPAPWAGTVLLNIVHEIGSSITPDRLAVFLKGANQSKGRLFGGGWARVSTFTSLEAGEQQVLAAREIGQIFTYMNQDHVWRGFCNTYNAIRQHLIDFDNWYNNPNRIGWQANDVSDLALDWENFIRWELDNVVNSAVANLIFMLISKKPTTADQFWDSRWFQMLGVPHALGGQITRVTLSRTDICIDLAPSEAILT